MLFFTRRDMIILLFMFDMANGSFTRSRQYNRFANTNTDTIQSEKKSYRVTLDCGNITYIEQTVWRCQNDIRQLAGYGYPWSLSGSHRHPGNKQQNVTNKTVSLRDALDSLDHVCYIQDRSQACLEENGIRDYCLIATVYIHLQKDFQFICHHQSRTESLLHSLQCLHDTRLLTMLYFHIADRCTGMGILDDMMTRYKNAHFYTMDITPDCERTIAPLLYCLPKSVISGCIRYIVEDQCGAVTAHFVLNYLFFLQDRFGQALESAGLTSYICDQDISSHLVPSKQPIPTKLTELGFSRLLEITAPGTALDTVFGKRMVALVKSFSGEEFCTTLNAWTAYDVCVMSSDSKSEKNKFNILQFAHGIIPAKYHGAQCEKLEQFTACWNLLRNTCGPKVRGMEQHATLLVEGCKIQSEMDAVECRWQDILLPYYIQASRVTLWPIVTQCLHNRMSLENSSYVFNVTMSDLDTAIALLQPGVDDISRRCAPYAAKRIRSVLNKLHYLQRDAVKYTKLLDRSLIPKY